MVGVRDEEVGIGFEAATGPKAAYAEDRQRDFCAKLLEDMGFDFGRGRLDRSTHPFTMMAGEGPVGVSRPAMATRTPAMNSSIWSAAMAPRSAR